MKLFVKGSRNFAVDTTSESNVQQLKALIQDQEGIPASDQRLLFGGRQLDDAQHLSSYGITQSSTLDLCLRLLGGSNSLQLTIKPRIQKDKWSLYWKESMETKTEMLDDIKVSLPASTTVAQVQKEVEKKMSWEPTNKLERLEGFKEPWEMTVYKGRALLPDKTLEECGVTSGTHLITVRRVLIKEGWKIITEGEEEEDDDDSDEDGW